MYGRIARKVETNTLGGTEMGDFLVETLCYQKVLSLNEVSQHVLSSTHAKLIYLTEERRTTQMFVKDRRRRRSSNISIATSGTAGNFTALNLDVCVLYFKRT